MSINIGIIQNNQRKIFLEIYKTDTVKDILDKFYDNRNYEGTRLYTLKEKVLFKNGDGTLNDTEESLKKTADDLGIENDDTLEWMDAEALNAGKNIKFL